MDVGDSVLLSQIVLPEGVTIPALESGADHDATIANAIHVKESQGSDADLEMAPKPEVEAGEPAKPEAAAKDDKKGA
jgi:hypothetical protein